MYDRSLHEQWKQRLARILMEKSYREGDFVLASGRRSDYYFDCRVTALHSEGSWLIGNLFADLVSDLDIAGVGGMTIGADPLTSAVTVIAHTRGQALHGFLVRKESKDHGTAQQIEGLANFSPGARVAVLEDVITSGASLLRAAEKVTAAGLIVAAACAVLDRGEGGAQAIAAAGYERRVLFTRHELLSLGRAG